MSGPLSGQVCSRCLVIQDVRMTVRAKWAGEDGKLNFETASDPTNPGRLRAWVVAMMERGAELETDAMPRAFEPAGTYGGDLVCWWHLTECVDRERRGRR